MTVQDPHDPRWQGVSNATLVDLVDRLLAGGVVLAGDITLAAADVDLVHISLRALVSSVETLASGPPELEDLAGRDAG
jgi:hypothetical protein